MLNAGRGDLKGAEPGVVITPTLPSPVGANNSLNTNMFALCEDVLCDGGSSTPGSAAPRPALSIIGQLRCPFPASFTILIHPLLL